MKIAFTFFSILFLMISNVSAQSGDEILSDQGSRVIIPSSDINVTPLPLTFGDATVCIHTAERIVKIGIYTVTGQKLYQQLFDTDFAKFTLMPYDIVPGEYILKVETVNGIGIKSVQIK